MDQNAPRPPVKLGEAMGIVWDVLFAIAIPTVLFALSGRWLDRKLGTSPLFLGIGLILALVVTGIIVYRKGKRIAKDL